MLQLRNLYLLLSSFCLVACLNSCRISKYKHTTSCNRVFITRQAFPPVLNETTVSKFKATIDVLKNHLSGIIIVKKTDSVSTHIIFVTEIGMKLFDFEWKDNQMTPVYVFEPINKPTLINALQTNFKAIFLLDVFNAPAGACSNKHFKSYYELEGYKYRYIVADTLKGITTQSIFNKNKKSCRINYNFVPENKTYNHIKCIQYGFVKIRTELTKIDD